MNEWDGWQVVFARRHITRDPSKVTDLEVPMDVEEFQRREAAGEHQLSWFRHGTHYAIPKSAFRENKAQPAGCWLSGACYP